MNKYDRFFEEYKSLDDEGKQLKLLADFMLSLSPQELIEFTSDNFQKIKEGEKQQLLSAEEQLKIDEKLDEAMLRLKQLKKKKAA